MLHSNLLSDVFEITGVVEVFPQKGGWFFVKVPYKFTKLLNDFSERGLIAVSASLGGITWDTSLLPFGDGTHFIALNAKVMKHENIKLKDKVQIFFKLRER